MSKPSKLEVNLFTQKAVIIANGAFNPPNFLHLRAFETAKSFVAHKFQLHVSEGIISPIGENTFTSANTQLVSSTHRLQMCQLAVKDSSWIRVNNWQGTRPCCKESQVVSHRLLELLKHFQQFYSNPEGTAIKVRIFLICGWHLLQQIVGEHTGQQSNNCAKFPTDLTVPCNERLGKASEFELKELLENFDLLVFWNSLCQINKTKPCIHPLLAQYKHNIHLIEQEEDFCTQFLSSFRLRAAISRGDCVRYCLPDPVITYIQAHDLYHCSLQEEMFKNRFKSSKSSINSLKCNNNVNNLANWNSYSGSKVDDAYTRLPNGHCQYELPSERLEEEQRLINELMPASLMTKSLTFEPSTSSAASENEEKVDSNDIWKPNDQQTNNFSSSKIISKSQNLLNYSSDYDNLTLDEILETSRGWDNYFNGLDQGLVQSTSMLKNSAGPENIEDDERNIWRHHNSHVKSQNDKLNCDTRSKEREVKEEAKPDSNLKKLRNNHGLSNCQCKSTPESSIWQQRHRDTDTPQVVLTFRRYRLFADPETTV